MKWPNSEIGPWPRLTRGVSPCSAATLSPFGRPTRGPACPCAAHPPRPGRNLGLGWENSLPRDPSWAAFSPKCGRSILAVQTDRTVTRRFRWVKTQRPTTAPQTLVHFSLSLLSPRERRRLSGRRKESGGAAAGPLTGARAHPCGSAPPSSGLAVVPFRIPARARGIPAASSGASCAAPR